MQDPTPLKEAGQDIMTPEQRLLKELYQKNTSLAAIGVLGIDEGKIAEDIGMDLARTLIEVAEFYGEDYEEVVLNRTTELATELITKSYRKG